MCRCPVTAEGDAAIARIRTYVDMQQGYSLGDLAYSADFVSDTWPYFSYALRRSDMQLLLERMDRQHTECAERTASLSASVQHLHAVVKAVLDQAKAWEALAPANDWGESMDDAVLSDVGRAIQRIVKDAYKEASHEERDTGGESE